MILNSNENLEIYIFNVERGLSILCKTPQNHVLIYDLGSTGNFSPIRDIYKQKNFFSRMQKYENEIIEQTVSSHITAKEYKIIAQTIISHPHLDHISDLTDDNFDFINNNSALITCQNDKEEKQNDSNYNKSGHKIDFNRINNPKDSISQINNYKKLYKNRQLPLRTIDPNVTGSNFKIGYYYLTHRQVNDMFSKDQDYTNSLSIVLYIFYNGHSILIPGDITPEAFELILRGKCEKRFMDCNEILSDFRHSSWTSSTNDEQPDLRRLLSNNRLTFLIAPHHGLKSGYCQYLFKILEKNKPEVILISEKSESDNSGSIATQYQDGTCSNGIVDTRKVSEEVDDDDDNDDDEKEKKKKRYSLTTRNDGHIKIVIGDVCTKPSDSDYLLARDMSVPKKWAIYSYKYYGDMFKMNSEEINCTSIFLDVRNFTELMKEYSGNPEFLKLIKNVYEIGQGVVSTFCVNDKYYINSTGDGFLCIIFGDDHYIKAYLIGLLIIKHLPHYFEQFFVNYKDHQLQEGQYYFGVGIESGYVEQVKTSQMHVKCIETYIGNVINISARIESLCKEHARAPMLYGPTINNLISENVFNVSYEKLIEKAKDSNSQKCANNDYSEMTKINRLLLSTYIFEHNLKGVDKPIPIFRISPTQFKNLKINEWKFLQKIPNNISDVFSNLYQELKTIQE